MAFAESQARRPYEAFGRLTPAQRRYLIGWCDAARAIGIDEVQDLAERPWPQAGADTIIGVFRSGQRLASWLVVERGGSWAVANCNEAAVSEAVPSLADALAIICPVTPLIIPS